MSNISKKLKKKIKGFSLVELSVVLIIIGILIGGLLVTQSVIRTSKVERAIKDIQMLDAARASFKAIHMNEPGDSSSFSYDFPVMGIIVGNDDGYVDDDESGIYWYSLSKGVGLKNANKTNYAAFSTSGSSTYPTAIDSCPVFAFDQAAQQANYPACLVLVSDSLNETTFTKPSGWVNFYFYGSLGLSTNGTSVFPTATGAYNPLMPMDAEAMDMKMDDGVPLTGNLISEDHEIAGGCHNGAVYYSDTKEYRCSLYIKTLD